MKKLSKTFLSVGALGIICQVAQPAVTAATFADETKTVEVQYDYSQADENTVQWFFETPQAVTFNAGTHQQQVDFAVKTLDGRNPYTGNKKFNVSLSSANGYKLQVPTGKDAASKDAIDYQVSTAGRNLTASNPIVGELSAATSTLSVKTKLIGNPSVEGLHADKWTVTFQVK